MVTRNVTSMLVLGRSIITDGKSICHVTNQEKVRFFSKHSMPCDKSGKSLIVIKTFNAGEMVEGILRINPKNYEDGYICAADNGQDILIQVGWFGV